MAEILDDLLMLRPIPSSPKSVASRHGQIWARAFGRVRDVSAARLRAPYLGPLIRDVRPSLTPSLEGPRSALSRPVRASQNPPLYCAELYT